MDYTDRKNTDLYSLCKWKRQKGCFLAVHNSKIRSYAVRMLNARGGEAFAVKDNGHQWIYA